MINQAKNRKFHEKIRGLAELIPWMLEISNGIVINKDGSLMACFLLDGVDVEGRSQIDIDTFSVQAELAFREMDFRSIIWSTVQRRQRDTYLTSHEFKDEVSAKIDELWKNQLYSEQQFVNQHSISIIIRPDGRASRFFDRVSQYQGEGMSFTASIIAASKSLLFSQNAFVHDVSELESQIAGFQKIISAFKTNLADFNLKHLHGEDLLSYLHAFVSPLNEDQPIKKSNISSYLDTYLPDSQVAVFESHLQFTHHKKRLVGGISIKDWPGASAPGLLDSLLSIPAPITATQVFQFTDDDESEAFIRNTEKHFLSSSKTISTLIREQISKTESDKVDQGKLDLAADAADALREITVEKKRFGYYTFNVLYYGDSKEELEYNLDLVIRALKQNGAISIVETDHLQSVFATSLPGQYGENRRWHFVNTANLADLAFLRTFSTGPKFNEYLTEELREPHESLTTLPTEHSTPCYYNFHSGDVGHAFVLGPTGNGKSTFTNFLISQFRKYKKSKVYIFDKDYSTEIPTVLQGGKFIDLRADGSTIKLNPLHLLHDEANWKWIKTWLEILLSYRGLVITPEMDKDIWHAIEQCAASDRSHWTLSTISSYCTADISVHLAIWCEGGQFGHFFDNVEDDFELSDFVAFEMGGLFDNPTLAIAFLEYAFFTILQGLDGTPTLIEIEEVWFMLGFPHLASKLKDWLKTFRKKNAFVVFATQSLSDLADSEIFTTIIDSIPTRIYLPNPEALTHYKMYREKFNLNDNQIERIRTAVMKRNYYIVQPGRSRMIDCRFPKSIVNALRSNPDARKSFHAIQNSGDPNWRATYLKEMMS